jgi:thiosulfate dehydrogenase (quinone) large subunit
MPPAIPELATSGTQNTYALAGLRIAVGILFLIFGQYKVFDTQFTLHGGFQFWINGFLEHGAYPFMVTILRTFVLPHATPIAFLVAYGEIAIGLALTLGVFVRLASGAGIIYMLALLFSSNYPVPSDYPSSGTAFWEYFGASLDHSVLGLCFAAFLVGRADAVWRLRISHPKSVGR